MRLRHRRWRPFVDSTCACLANASRRMISTNEITRAKGAAMDAITVTHEIQPVFDSPQPRAAVGHYALARIARTGFCTTGTLQNRFWCARDFQRASASNHRGKAPMPLRHHIALWDARVVRNRGRGSDASIRDAQPNDLARIFDVADICAVFATGTKAGELYRKLVEPTLGVPCTTLPSTSPANAKMKLDDLADAYGKALLPLLGETEKHVLPVADVVKLEQAIAKNGTSLSTLMERAGRALAMVASDEARRRPGRATRAMRRSAKPMQSTMLPATTKIAARAVLPATARPLKQAAPLMKTKQRPESQFCAARATTAETDGRQRELVPAGWVRST